MSWRPLTNDNDILQAGDQFRLWLGDQTWSAWSAVVGSVGMTLRQFVYSFAWPKYLNGEPPKMVEVRRPVTEGDER